jgi:predicted nucleic acid-binding protein
LRFFLLDTNVISEVRKRKPHGGVLSWLNALAPNEMFLPAVVLGELQTGSEITRMQNAEKAREIEDWIDRITNTLSVVAMDGRCFSELARLMHGRADGLWENAMIAATARVYRLIVATRNERDFALFDVPVFNPFRLSS